MKLFDKYSAYYDLLYADKDYQGEAKYIHGLIQKHSPKSKSILDLGCGTGKHAFCFAEMGYNVDGVDFAPTMVKKANENLNKDFKQHKESLFFDVGDIREYRNEKKYDVVVSLFHVMSYQTTNDDLKSAFETARTHLKKGGIFIFDFWYGPGVLSDLPSVRVKRLENNDIKVVRIAEPITKSQENCVEVNYTVIIQEKSTGEVEEIRETHKMRYLFLPEILQFMNVQYLISYKWEHMSGLSMTDWNGVCIYKNYK